MDDWTYAYQATKTAIYCVLEQTNENNYYGIDATGERTADLIRRLVNEGENGTRTYKTPVSNVSKSGNITLNGDYYIQNYIVTANVDISTYRVLTSRFPDNTKVTDTAGNEKRTFNAGETFQVRIPKNSVETGDINGNVRVDVSTKAFPIFFGQTYDPTLQNYAITTDPIALTSNSASLEMKGNTGSIKVVKKDVDTNEPISNTTFELSKEDGTVIGTATTDVAGVVTFLNLYQGIYNLKEIKNNDNYVLSNEITKVIAEYNKTTEVQVTNEKKKGQIRVIKVDKDNNEIKLAGVEFNVIDSKGNVVDKLITNANGEATSKRLPINENYTIQETKTLENYVLNTEKITITLKEEQITNTIVSNEKKKGQIKVVKVDEDYNEIKLQNVEFDVLNSKGDIVDKLITDINGEAVSKMLPIDDTYTVRERKTLINYILNDQPITVTLRQNEISDVEFGNKHKEGNLQVYKVDKDNNKIGLGNIEFDLYSEEFKKVVGTYTTDVNGELFIENLRIGSYKLIEKITNKWYNLNDEAIEIKINWGEITDTLVENELKKGQIKVIKKDFDNNEITLEGVKFDVIDEKGTVLETIITDENGEAYTTEYPVRDYEKLVIREVETLEDYVLQEVPQTIELKANEVTTIEFTNELKKGQIKVIKIDKDNNEITLEGVKFNVYDEEKNLIQTIVTDEKGEAVTDRIPINKTYTVQEIETDKNYVLSEETITVILKENEIKDVIFENEKKKGKIEVVKIDSDNNEIYIPDVTFEVYNSKNEVVDIITTDETGKAITKELPIDDVYTVKETITNKEYVLTEETQKVVLTQDQITNIQFMNEKIKGQIEITKISADDNELTGEEKGSLLKDAVFEIYTEDDELVDTITILENGKGTSKLLEYGNYYVIEKNSGSDYYLLNTERYYIEIRENMETIPITIENPVVDIGLEIEKNGIIQAQANDEIRYNFNSLKNTSNVSLDNFTWIDNLPFQYVRITKLLTGTYNEDLDYVVKYKTNKSDGYIEYGKYNTQKNNYIDFTKVNLAEDEYITDYKVEFGTVMPGFEAIEKPCIFTKVLPTVTAEDKWTNNTKLTGNYKEHELEDNDDWTTISYKKELKINKLPKTGF